MLKEDAKLLGELQERLFAEDKWSVLVVLQGMDTAGKDGIIEHVMAGVNPQGCVVHAFKAPSAEEIDHDFLWRSAHAVARTRAHRHLQPLALRRGSGGARPSGICWRSRSCRQPSPGRSIWKHRFKSIRGFERHLARNGTIVLKFFLHISREEQRQRLLARLEEPAKRWKFSAGDIAERKLWDKYMAAYEDAIRATSRDACALVRRAGRQQAVRAAGGGAGDRRRALAPRSQISDGRGRRPQEMQKIRTALLAEGPAAASRVAAQAVLLHEGCGLLLAARA